MRSTSTWACCGFEEQARYGDQAVFISAGGYHHHIGLNTWESKGASPPPPGHTGLYHVAIRYPDRKALADALRRLVEAGIPLSGASDHGVSEALYLHDPDGNGVELYRDRPREEWPMRPDGDGVDMFTAPARRACAPRRGRLEAPLGCYGFGVKPERVRFARALSLPVRELVREVFHIWQLEP